MRNIMRCASLMIVVSAAPGTVAAQEVPADRDAALRMFLDCPNFFCDLDFYRREISFVSYVRDRQDADVHVLIATQATGGGREHTLNFIGLRDFEGIETTLVYNSSATDTPDETRNGLARVIKFGLMRYVAESSVADQIDINFRADRPEQAREPVEDRWNYWVFTISANGTVNIQARNKFYNGFGSVTANRTTEDWKFNIRVNGSYNESRFELDDGSDIVSTRESYGTNGLLVRSLGDHWGAGVIASVNRASFTNIDLRFRFTPAVEYNIFPYSESSSRQLTFRYAAGINAVNYEQETLFDKFSETLAEHSLTGALSFTQPWGSSSVSLTGLQLLNDLSKNRLTLFANTNIRLVRGLSLRLFGVASRVRDQLFLPKAGATDEEVLLRRRQLETSFTYFVSAGFTYRFGSIFNNIVNPRFGGAGGGEGFFF